MDDMFYGDSLSVANYDALLIGWAAQTLFPNVAFCGGNSKYSCAAITAHNILTGTPNSWIITDGGLVDDGEDPTITCPSNFTVVADDNSQTYTVQGTELDPLAFDDNCMVSYLINDFSNSNSLNGSVLDLGTTTILWTVADASGRQTTCNFDATIESFGGIEDETSLFSVYPNPTTGNVNIEADNLQNYSLIIISDELGRIIKTEKIESNNMSIDLSDKNPGLYFIEIQGNENSIFTKVMVE